MTERTAHIAWDVLNEYEDGLLSKKSALAVEAHLATCDVCRASHAALRDTLTALHGAPAQLPATDLWRDIRSSIEATPKAGQRTAKLRQFTFSGTSLAAAALLLVAVSVSATMWIGSRTNGAGVVAGADNPGSVTTLQLTATDAQFVASVDALEKQLTAQRAKLRPETVAILERSLRTIDDALVEARTALLADPANTALKDALESTYRQKLEFLERATQIASSE